jgi:hypothetical protein
MSKFPTKDNPQPCKNGCGTKIYLSNYEKKLNPKTGKKLWLPYEIDGAYHNCPNKPNPGLDKYSTATTATTATTTEQVQDKPADMTVKVLVDRLAKVGIYLDVKSIMNPKKDAKEEQK